MGARSSRLVHVLRNRWAAAVLVALSGCSSFSITSPTDNSIVSSPTTVDVVGNSSIDQLQNITLTQQDGSANPPVTPLISHMNYVSPTEYRGQINIPMGPNRGPATVTANAIVGCWYCAGRQYQATDTKNFCVSVPTSSNNTATTFALSDNKSWTSDSSAVVSLGQDSGLSNTQWQFEPYNAATVGTTPGIIHAAPFGNCKCISANPDNSALHAPAPTAFCDREDQRQQWFADDFKTSAGKAFYRFHNREVGWACLTESPAGQLVQENCNGADNKQYFAVRENANPQRFLGGELPWNNPS
jgi:hypothetical protein